MIIETSLMRQTAPQEAQRLKHARFDVRAWRVLALVRDAQSRKTKSGRGNARNFAWVLAIRAAAVLNQPYIRIR
jgi:hypothetical protein